MLKLICLFSDGTGNSSSSPFKTNVFRLYDALDRSADAGQIAYYDDGVGSSQHRILALIGGAFGYGLKRNVLDLYKFLTRHYGDALRALEVDGVIPEESRKDIPKIACFGFSRGAFTIRVLIGLVESQGLPISARNEAELDWLAREAYNNFRRDNFHTRFRIEDPFRKLRDWAYGLLGEGHKDAYFEKNVDINFLGLWDTVGAYGMPVEELRIAIDRYLFPLTFTSFDICGNVKFVRHALSIDDERDAFNPIPFDDYDDRLEAEQDRKKVSDALIETGMEPDRAQDEAYRQVCERSQQIWFAGVHANVGGGYPDDSQAILPLRWIMREAIAHGVAFRKSVIDDIEKKATAFGQLYDSRAGLAALYRYKPRDLDQLLNEARKPTVAKLIEAGRTLAPERRIWPLIHESVIFRMAARFEGYAPIALPQQFGVVDDTGRVRKLVKFAQDAKERTGRFADGDRRAKTSGLADLVEKLTLPTQAALDLVADAVFWRRVSYQATIWSLILLILMPLCDYAPPDEEGLLKTIFVWVVNIVAKFLPGFVSPWLDAFRAYPYAAGALLLVFGGSFLWGYRLRRIIADRSRAAWSVATAAGQNPLGRKLWDPLARKLRNSTVANRIWDTLSNHVVPMLFVVLLVLVGAGIADRLVFQVRAASGYVCTASASEPRSFIHEERFTLDTGEPCRATGLKLQRDRYYLATFRIVDDWKDGGVGANLGGWRRNELTPLENIGFTLSGLVTKRVLWELWFQPILQFDARGLDILAAKPAVPFPSGSDKQEMTVRFKAPRDGELFVYVNDAYTGFLPVGLFSNGACGAPTSLFHRYGNNCGSAEVTLTPLPEEYGD